MINYFNMTKFLLSKFFNKKKTHDNKIYSVIISGNHYNHTIGYLEHNSNKFEIYSNYLINCSFKYDIKKDNNIYLTHTEPIKQKNNSFSSDIVIFDDVNVNDQHIFQCSKSGNINVMNIYGHIIYNKKIKPNDKLLLTLYPLVDVDINLTSKIIKCYVNQE